jgi:hypothetical protein
MSGNVSGWAEECDLYVLSQGYYGQHLADLPNANSTYKSVFGGEIIYGTNQVVTFKKDGQPFNLELKHVINSAAGYKSSQWIADSDTSTQEEVYSSTTSGAVQRSVTSKKKNGVWGKKYKYTLHVKGPSNVNLHMIAMYANAVNSIDGTASVNYPVLPPQGTLFSSSSDYATYLYTLALAKPTKTGIGLNEIITTYDKGMYC